MIRVLQCVNNMHRAGLETMLMNYYRNIDRTKIQFDFLTHRPERSDYDDEIESLGGRMYYAPRLYPQNYAAYFSFMKEFFKEHPEYQIVHSHIDSMSFLPLLSARRAGVPIRIAHSHSTSIDRDIKYYLKQFFRKNLSFAANEYLSCGENAGKFLFGEKNFTIIPNAIDPRKFTYDETLRAKTRKELGIENAFVIGHVGRFSYPKNHLFLLEVFAELVKREENSVLLLVGCGEKENEVREKAEKLRLSRHIQFLGNCADVNRFYQAMDVFVMPSLFEGVPVVGIEAQFAHLPCVFSDRVPDEVAFTEICSFLSLEETAEYWAERILQCSVMDRNAVLIPESKYDIRNAHLLLTDYYSGLLKGLSGTRIC